VIPPFILSFFAGRGLKIFGFAAVFVAAVGMGFKLGLDFRLGLVEAARAKQMAAETRAGQQEDRAAKAERDYNTLRREVADAMKAAQDQAITLENENNEARERASKDYRARVDGVMDSHKRLLGAIAKGRGQDSSAALSQDCPARGADDPASEERFAARLRDAALAEGRLEALQRLVADHDSSIR
jgi:hypothetical protein